LAKGKISVRTLHSSYTQSQW